MNDNECGMEHLLYTYSTAMECFGAKAIQSSSGVSFEVQSRGEKCTFLSKYSGAHM